MKKLLRIEWIKTWNYIPFRVILLLHFVLFFLVVLIFSRIDVSIPGFRTRNLFEFPHIWQTFSWVASWFNLLLAITIIMLAGNEFSYHTARQQVMNGLSRSGLLGGKSLVIAGLALYGLFLVFLTSLVLGLAFSRDLTFGMVMENMQILLVYFVQAVAYMALALLFTLIIRNNAVSIIGFIMYFALIEPVIRRFFPRDIRAYFPVRVISHLTPVPEVLTITSEQQFNNAAGESDLDLAAIGIGMPEIPELLRVTLALVYIGLFVAGSYLILRRRRL